MTQEQLEDYIERLLPRIRKAYIHYPDETELCQRALVDLYKTIDRISANNDKEFIKLFLRYYRTWQWYRRTTIAKNLANNNLLAEFMVADKTIDENAYGYNPWQTNRTEALEYIELVGDPHLKQVMTWYYIEGYTITEISKGINKSVSSTLALLRNGVERIKGWVLT